MENSSILLCHPDLPHSCSRIMAEQNWDDHDRSGKYSCRDYAAKYLNSCGKQGILFTNGDNDTFPLWYDQEVEGIRTDVRVVNIMLASGSSYIDGLFKKSTNQNLVLLGFRRRNTDPGRMTLFLSMILVLRIYQPTGLG